MQPTPREKLDRQKRRIQAEPELLDFKFLEISRALLLRESHMFTVLGRRVFFKYARSFYRKRNRNFSCKHIAGSLLPYHRTGFSLRRLRTFCSTDDNDKFLLLAAAGTKSRFLTRQKILFHSFSPTKYVTLRSYPLSLGDDEMRTGYERSRCS